MLPLLLSLALHGGASWDGPTSVQVPVGASVSIDTPTPLRFVSVGGGDVVDVTVSRDLKRIQLKGLRKGTRTVTAYFRDGKRVRLELAVVPKHR